MCKGRWVCFLHMCSVTQSCPTLLKPHGLWPLPRLLCPWDSPGKNSGVGCHFLLQGIFQPRDGTRVSSTAVDSLPLSHKGSLRYCVI